MSIAGLPIFRTRYHDSAARVSVGGCKAAGSRQPSAHCNFNVGALFLGTAAASLRFPARPIRRLASMRRAFKVGVKRSASMQKPLAAIGILAQCLAGCEAPHNGQGHSPAVVGAWIVKIADAPFPLHMFVFCTPRQPLPAPACISPPIRFSKLQRTESRSLMRSRRSDFCRTEITRSRRGEQA